VEFETGVETWVGLPHWLETRMDARGIGGRCGLNLRLLPYEGKILCHWQYKYKCQLKAAQNEVRVKVWVGLANRPETRFNAGQMAETEGFEPSIQV
jgi:hypothetical protein